MMKYKYTFERGAQRFTIQGNTSCGPFDTEKAARIACAREIDLTIAILQQEVDSLTELRNSVYMGELPPHPPKA